MTRQRKGRQVSEPIQVYLTEADRSLLDRVAAAARLSRAEVLRRGLRRFSADVLAESHPVLAYLDELAGGWRDPMPHDVAGKHDQYLAEEYRRRPARTKR